VIALGVSGLCWWNWSFIVLSLFAGVRGIATYQRARVAQPPSKKFQFSEHAFLFVEQLFDELCASIHC
jgi:hypothetical protein